MAGTLGGDYRLCAGCSKPRTQARVAFLNAASHEGLPRAFSLATKP